VTNRQRSVDITEADRRGARDLGNRGNTKRKHKEHKEHKKHKHKENNKEREIDEEIDRDSVEERHGCGSCCSRQLYYWCTSCCRKKKRKKKRKLEEVPEPEHEPEPDDVHLEPELVNERERNERLKRRKEREIKKRKKEERRERKRRERAERHAAVDMREDVPHVVEDPKKPPSVPIDPTKTCCYLCVQNTMAIMAASAKPERCDKSVQALTVRLPIAVDTRPCRSLILMRATQSPIRVRMRDASVMCIDEECIEKVKRPMVLPRVTKMRCPARPYGPCNMNRNKIPVGCNNRARERNSGPRTKRDDKNVSEYRN